jgi:hypothetical protein
MCPVLQASTWLKSWDAPALWCRHASCPMLRPPRLSGASGPPSRSCTAACRTAAQVLHSRVPHESPALFRRQVVAMLHDAAKVLTGLHEWQGRWAGGRWSTGCGRCLLRRGSCGGRRNWISSLFRSSQRQRVVTCCRQPRRCCMAWGRASWHAQAFGRTLCTCAASG